MLTCELKPRKQKFKDMKQMDKHLMKGSGRGYGRRNIFVNLMICSGLYFTVGHDLSYYHNQKTIDLSEKGKLSSTFFNIGILSEFE